jgi:hypothetical protein
MSKFNDIDLANWRDYEHILTDSLWLFPERGSNEKLDFHGAFIPQVAEQLLLRYSKEKDVVLDPFIGSGTTAAVAEQLGRKCIGLDINPEAIQDIKERYPQAIVGAHDATSAISRVFIRNTLSRIGQEYCQLAILHPPYGDIINFTDLPRDLSNAPSSHEFLDLFRLVAELIYDMLEPGRFAALVIGDKYADGKLEPLGFYCMSQMQYAGFTLKAIVIKDIQNNEVKGKDANLWRYRALASAFYLFKHEYIMVFQKG